MSGISSATSGLEQAQLAHQVAVKVAGKAMDAARAQGDAAISLLEAAAEVQEQALSGLEPGKGQVLDVTA